MTGFHQILAGASAGDAITNVALELRSLLRRIGPSEIYARHVGVGSDEEIRCLADYPDRTTSDVLIYHASIGEPYVQAFLLSRREPLVLVYHNVTPAEYFTAWDATFAELLELGRMELVDLRHRVTVAIADSVYNARELEEIGYEEVHVVPPVVDPARLRGVTPDPATTNHLENVIDGPVVLSVGQLLPHKRPELLIDALHVAATYLGVSAHLMLVGHARVRNYEQALKAHLRELNLPRVHVVGALDASALVSMFRRASVFVTASAHEGFCVPLLEAMAFDLPIIAPARAAIPGTVGDAALLLPADATSSLYAEAMREMLTNEHARGDLVARGRRRLGDFASDVSAARFLGAIGRAL